MRKKTAISLLVVGAFIICATAAAAAEPRKPGGEAQTKVYNPKLTYPGNYNPDVLLFRLADGHGWQRVTGLDRLRRVACRDALEKLQTVGRWQGHLNPDGTCGSTAEPSDWIMGNRLNYEDSLE
jgi:hypothetical protein